MTITIHRGTHQIGGCITEIKSNHARIIIDMGEELPSTMPKTKIEIEGVTTSEADCNGVFITHYHGDHVGLYGEILSDVPVFMGELAKKIFLKLKTRCRDKNIASIERFTTFRQAQRIEIGDMVITPLRVDHSAFDAYMFLIECEGKKILHTGDFRTHGFTGKAALPTLENWVKNVDVLITEGTMLSRNDDAVITERELQQQARKLLKENKYVFVMCSSTNIDRIAALHKAMPPMGKYFLCDDYQKKVLDTVSQYAKSPLYKFEKVHTYGANLLEKMRKQGFCMLVRSDSSRPYFKPIMAKFPDSLFVYSMWKGYLDGAAKIEAISTMVPSDYVYLHTSGHATREAIRKVCETVRPKTIIPIHGVMPEAFKDLGVDGEVKVLDDGERFVI